MWRVLVLDGGQDAKGAVPRYRLWKISRYSKIAVASSIRVFQGRRSSSSRCISRSQRVDDGITKQSGAARRWHQPDPRATTKPGQRQCRSAL